MILAPGRFKIVAEIEDRDGGRCPLLEDLHRLGANYARSRAGLVLAIQMAARDGVKGVGWVERACSDEPPVFKIRKGDLRLYFCFSDDAVIVCSECAVKKTQKTEKHYCKAARTLLVRYNAASKAKSLRETTDYERILAFL